MGEVYRARDTRLNRTVAIPSDAGCRSTGSDARFQREARTLATLSHPHICSVFDVGRQNGVDYLVMEFLEGHTLAHRLRGNGLPLDETLKIAIQLADGLDKAHRQNVVHRDLKPGNIVLTKSGAKTWTSASRSSSDGRGSRWNRPAHPHAETAEGTILGTLQYMAPEQLEGKEADPRADIFAFGAIVYEMVTGRRSFDGQSQASLIAAILDRDPPAMSTLQPMTPSSLERVIRKCLAKDADARWQSAGDLLEELKWIADGTLGDTGLPQAGEPRRRRALTVWVSVSTIFSSPHSSHWRPLCPAGGRGRRDQVRGYRSEHLESPSNHNLSRRGVWRSPHPPMRDRALPQTLRIDHAGAVDWHGGRLFAFLVGRQSRDCLSRAGGRTRRSASPVAPCRLSATRQTWQEGLELDG